MAWPFTDESERDKRIDKRDKRNGKFGRVPVGGVLCVWCCDGTIYKITVGVDGPTTRELVMVPLNVPKPGNTCERSLAT